MQEVKSWSFARTMGGEKKQVLEKEYFLIDMLNIDSLFKF